MLCRWIILSLSEASTGRTYGVFDPAQRKDRSRADRDHPAMPPACISGLLAGFTGSVAGGQPIDEYHTKAAFLYKLHPFVDWPPEAFQTPNDAFAICVLDTILSARH